MDGTTEPVADSTLAAATAENRCSLHVTKLPKIVSDKAMKALFPTSTGINKPKKAKFAFVTFSNEEDAASALAEVNEMKFRGQTLSVVYSKKSPEEELDSQEQNVGSETDESFASANQSDILDNSQTGADETEDLPDGETKETPSISKQPHDSKTQGSKQEDENATADKAEGVSSVSSESNREEAPLCQPESVQVPSNTQTSAEIPSLIPPAETIRSLDQREPQIDELEPPMPQVVKAPTAESSHLLPGQPQVSQTQSIESENSEPGNNEDTKSCKTLFVGNLPRAGTVEDLQALFPTAINVSKPNKAKFGLVAFATVEEATLNLKKMTDFIYQGKELCVKHSNRDLKQKENNSSQPDTSQEPPIIEDSEGNGPSAVLLLKRLQKGCTQEELELLLPNAKRVKKFTKAKFGLVEYATREESVEAFRRVDGLRFQGESILALFGRENNDEPAANEARGTGGYSTYGADQNYGREQAKETRDTGGYGRYGANQDYVREQGAGSGDDRYKLLVKNLSRYARVDKIWNLFPNAVNIHKPEKETFAYVEFDNENHTAEAFSRRHGTMFQGQELLISYCGPDQLRHKICAVAVTDTEQPFEDKYTVYVSNLPRNELPSFNALFPNAKEIIKPKKSRYALVHFDNTKDSAAAMKKINGMMLEGQTLSASYSTRKKSKVDTPDVETTSQDKDAMSNWNSVLVPNKDDLFTVVVRFRGDIKPKQWVRQLFEKFGPIKQLEYKSGNAIIRYYRKGEALDALGFINPEFNSFVANECYEGQQDTPEIWESDGVPASQPKAGEAPDYLDYWEDTLVANERNLYVLIMPVLPGDQFMMYKEQFEMFGKIKEHKMREDKIFIYFSSRDGALNVLRNFNEQVQVDLAHESNRQKQPKPAEKQKKAVSAEGKKKKQRPDKEKLKEWDETIIRNKEGLYSIMFPNHEDFPQVRNVVNKFMKYGRAVDVKLTKNYTFARFETKEAAMSVLEVFGNEYNMTLPNESRLKQPQKRKQDAEFTPRVQREQRYEQPGELDAEEDDVFKRWKMMMKANQKGLYSLVFPTVSYLHDIKTLREHFVKEGHVAEKGQSAKFTFVRFRKKYEALHVLKRFQVEMDMRVSKESLKSPEEMNSEMMSGNYEGFSQSSNTESYNSQGSKIPSLLDMVRPWKNQEEKGTPKKQEPKDKLDHVASSEKQDKQDMDTSNLNQNLRLPPPPVGCMPTGMGYPPQNQSIHNQGQYQQGMMQQYPQAGYPPPVMPQAGFPPRMDQAAFAQAGYQPGANWQTGMYPQYMQQPGAYAPGMQQQPYSQQLSYTQDAQQQQIYSQDYQAQQPSQTTPQQTLEGTQQQNVTLSVDGSALEQDSRKSSIFTPPTQGTFPTPVAQSVPIPAAPVSVPDTRRIEEAKNKAKKLMEWEGILVPDKKGQYAVCLRTDLGLSSGDIAYLFGVAGTVVETKFTDRHCFIRYKLFEEAMKALELYSVQFGLKAGKPDNSGPVDAAQVAARQAALLQAQVKAAELPQKIDTLHKQQNQQYQEILNKMRKKASSALTEANSTEQTNKGVNESKKNKLDISNTSYQKELATFGVNAKPEKTRQKLTEEEVISRDINYYCKMCKIRTLSKRDYFSHAKSGRHQTLQNELTSFYGASFVTAFGDPDQPTATRSQDMEGTVPIILPGEEDKNFHITYYCKICKVGFSSQPNFNFHTTEKSHITTFEALRNMKSDSELNQTIGNPNEPFTCLEAEKNILKVYMDPPESANTAATTSRSRKRESSSASPKPILKKSRSDTPSPEMPPPPPPLNPPRPSSSRTAHFNISGENKEEQMPDFASLEGQEYPVEGDVGASKVKDVMAKMGVSDTNALASLIKARVQQLVGQPQVPYDYSHGEPHPTQSSTQPVAFHGAHQVTVDEDVEDDFEEDEDFEVLVKQAQLACDFESVSEVKAILQKIGVTNKGSLMDFMSNAGSVVGSDNLPEFLEWVLKSRGQPGSPDSDSDRKRDHEDSRRDRDRDRDRDQRGGSRDADRSRSGHRYRERSKSRWSGSPSSSSSRSSREGRGSRR